MSHKLLRWQFKLIAMHEEQQAKTNNIKIQNKIQKIEKKKSKESIQGLQIDTIFFFLFLHFDNREN